MIWLSVNFDVFIKNLLRLSYEKILLLTSVNLRGDYRSLLQKHRDALKARIENALDQCGCQCEM